MNMCFVAVYSLFGFTFDAFEKPASNQFIIYWWFFFKCFCTVFYSFIAHTRFSINIESPNEVRRGFRVNNKYKKEQKKLIANCFFNLLHSTDLNGHCVLKWNPCKMNVTKKKRADREGEKGKRKRVKNVNNLQFVYKLQNKKCFHS